MDVAKELRPPGRVGVAIGRAGEMELQPLEQQQEGAEQIWDAGSPEGGLSSSEDGGTGGQGDGKGEGRRGGGLYVSALVRGGQSEMCGLILVGD